MLIEFSPEHLRAAGSGPEAFWTILDELGFEPWGFDEDGKAFRIEDRAAFSRAYETWIYGRVGETRQGGSC